MIHVSSGSEEITRFDALLRNLLAFGLVEHDGSGTTPGWRLNDSAQARLDQLGAHQPVVGELLYFGHRCANCGEHTPTRLRDGTYVCDHCTAVAPEPSYL